MCSWFYFWLVLLIKSTRRESRACRLRNGEAIFQHLKADNLIVGDGDHDGEVRFDNLSISSEPGRERAKNYCPFVVGQNVVNLEANSLNHRARIIDKISDGGSADIFS